MKNYTRVTSTHPLVRIQPIYYDIPPSCSSSSRKPTTAPTDTTISIRNNSTTTTCCCKVLSLPLTLGRKNLAEWWWNECPNGCQAMVQGSIPCTEYCLQIRRKQHLEALSRNLIEIDAQGNINITARHDHLIHWSGDLPLNGVCQLWIGDNMSMPWMNFTIELIRPVTPDHHPSVKQLTITGDVTKKRKIESLLHCRAMQDSPAKRKLFAGLLETELGTDSAGFTPNGFLDRRYHNSVEANGGLETQYHGTDLEQKKDVADMKANVMNLRVKLASTKTKNSKLIVSTRDTIPTNSTGIPVNIPLSAIEARCLSIKTGECLGKLPAILPRSDEPEQRTSTTRTVSSTVPNSVNRSLLSSIRVQRSPIDNARLFHDNEVLKDHNCSNESKCRLDVSSTLSLSSSRMDDNQRIQHPSSPVQEPELTGLSSLKTATSLFKSESNHSENQLELCHRKKELPDNSSVLILPFDKNPLSSSSSSQQSSSLEEIVTQETASSKIEDGCGDHLAKIIPPAPSSTSTSRHCSTLTLEEWVNLENDNAGMQEGDAGSIFNRAIIRLIVVKNRQREQAQQTRNETNATWLPSLFNNNTVLRR